MVKTFVIVGAGQAAGQAIVSLRQEGFDGRIILIGDETYVPYQRPPLSKKFLAGELGLERVYIKPEEFFAESRVELMLGQRVTRIDRPRKTLLMEDGTEVAYDRLLLATGSRVRSLPVPGVDLEGVHYLRSIDDVVAIRGHMDHKGERLVVVGGGYIGLEVAAIAVRRGVAVTVLEMEDRILARVTGEPISAFFTEVHRAEGVDIRTNQRVIGFEGSDGMLREAVCADGSRIPCDFAIVGIGIIPNSELAEEAGLVCNNGISVDEHGRTSDPDIFSAGDCTNHPNDLVGRRIRLESVQNAIDQAKVAAAAMCDNLKPYVEVPWFWSDQYDLKLQIAGLSEGYDQIVVRGDPASRKFAAFYLKEGIVIAVDAINAVPEFMIGKKLIAAQAKIAPERLADLDVSMKQLGSEFG